MLSVCPDKCIDMYTYLFVCIYICIYVCTYTCICICTQLYGYEITDIGTDTDTHKQVCISIHRHVEIHTEIDRGICMSIYRYAHIGMHTFLHDGHGILYRNNTMAPTKVLT